METLFIYIVKVNIALAVFYLLYMLLFRKDTFIRLRRFYFLSAIIFSLAYPLFTVSVLGSLINMTPQPVVTETSVYIGEATMGQVIVDDAEETATPINWTLVAKNILLVGTLFLSLRLLWQLLSIVRIKSHSEKRSLFGYLFYHLKDEITPFSFFNWIFVNSESHNEKELKQILLHENTHARQWHSLDILLVEMLRIAFWWNPFVWLMKRDIAINLEYLADEAVLQEGVETKEYQYHLLQLTNHETAVQIVNNFNVSQLKQRIIMMNRNKTPMRKLAKYLSVLPLALLLITVNSVYAQQNEPTQEPIEIKDKDANEKSRFHQVTENLDKLADILKSEVNYPQVAKERRIEGDVIVSFIIEVDGSTINPKVEIGEFPALNQEALRVINSMPKLTQFMYTEDGEALRIKYNSHFNFRLDGEKTSFDVAMRGYSVLTIADKTGDDKPLFIVDGVKMDKEFNMSQIDRSDIEHRTIYQKEAAIATYGEEGKNGAVLITTKKKIITPQEPVKKENEVIVRGYGSMEDKPIQSLAEKFGDSSPLIIVDDVKMVKGFELNSIIPTNIESITVLKDKSAVEQYGEEGKGGVVLVKLKDKAKFPTTTGKISEIRGEDEVIVRGFGSMKDKPVQTLAEKFGTDKPIYIVDGKKTENIDNIDPKNIESISVLKNESAISKYGDEGKNGVIKVITKSSATKSVLLDAAKEKLGGEIEEIFVVVEDQPQFPGGMEALMKYLGENIKYPVEAQKNKIEGRVIVNFVVNKDGSLSDFKVVRGQDPLLDAEAIRVLSTMPNWKPGMQRGQAVNVRFTLPIVFRLKADEEGESDAIQKLKEKGPVTVYEEKQDKPDEGFLKFIGQTIKYPLIAQENGIMGVVRAVYDVDEKGEVSNVRITESVDPSLAAELERVAKLMPKDIALLRSGGKAASDVGISALFRLQGEGSVPPPPPPPVESDVVVVGYGKPVE